MKYPIELLQASKEKATRQRDNWKRRALACQAAMREARSLMEKECYTTAYIVLDNALTAQSAAQGPQGGKGIGV